MVLGFILVLTLQLIVELSLDWIEKRNEKSCAFLFVCDIIKIILEKVWLYCGVTSKR